MPELTGADIAVLLRLPPREAIDYLERKGYAISWNWWEVWQDQQARAFTVAKLARLDVLADIRAEVERSLSDGITQRDFLQALAPRLKAAGWWGKKIVVDDQGNAEIAREGSPWRLETIFRTNSQTAYMAGRYRRQVDNAAARPYWQYVAVMDSRTRDSHAAMNGKIFPADDPIWQWLYPPCGFRCRCRCRALSARQVESRNLTVESSEGRTGTKLVKVGTDQRTGEVIERPVNTIRILDSDGQPMDWHPDPGWSYNPATGQDAKLQDLLERRLGR